MVEMAGHWQLVLSVAITTVGWVLFTLLTKPSKPETLHSFNNLIFGNESKFKGFGMKILGFFAGVVGVYCSLFAIGNFIYGKNLLGYGLTAVAVVCGLVIIQSLKNTDN